MRQRRGPSGATRSAKALVCMSRRVREVVMESCEVGEQVCMLAFVWDHPRVCSLQLAQTDDMTKTHQPEATLGCRAGLLGSGAPG